MAVVGALFLLGSLVIFGFQVSLIVRVFRADRAGDSDEANRLRMVRLRLRLALVAVFVLVSAGLVIAAVASS